MIGFEALICDPPYRTNVYYCIARERQIACVIDAAPGSFKALRSKLNGLEVHVFLTHGHRDHVADAKAFQENLKAKLYLHRDDVPLVNNVPLQKMIAGDQPYEPFEPDVLPNGGEIRSEALAFMIKQTTNFLSETRYFTRRSGERIWAVRRRK